MELKLIRGTNDVGKELLEVSTKEGRIVLSFGEDISTGEILENINPMIDGVTHGNPLCDGVFILRNPENSNLIEYTLEEIPIFLESRIKKCYEICADFGKCEMRKNVIGMQCREKAIIKDMEITYYLPDPSNQNTSMVLIKAEGKTILVSGDYRDHDIVYEKDRLEKYISEIGRVDYWFIEGKYFEKKGINLFDDTTAKLKNIMKFYKQVFIIQSETDTVTSRKMYEIAQKTKKIFIETTLLSNLTSVCNGSAPNPITSKKVYTYSPLTLNNKDFDFKKKYVAHFFIHNGFGRMKKEKYVMNLNTNMLQDVQLFDKEELIYDSCVILAMNKKLLQNKNLEDFVNMLKEYQIDYYELYTPGVVNFDFLNSKIMVKCKPENVIPIGFDIEYNNGNKMHKFKYMPPDEVLKI